MTISIFHLIQGISFGGACRAAVALAKYSSRFGQFSHSIASLDPSAEDKRAVEFVREEGVPVIDSANKAELYKQLVQADIVQLNWWNNPQMDTFLRGVMPPMRLVAWCHVGGHIAPQIILPPLIECVDMVVACSPYTYECPAIQALSTETRITKVAMAYGAADFARLTNLSAKPHDTFNVGYIGTVHFSKMHPDYFEMSASIEIPNVRFIVCGPGEAVETLRKTAETRGLHQRFDIKDYVEDIKSVLEVLDVYGYPLREDTYAASEVNLQEAMYAGIPPIVFPHGGISRLVIDNFTGLVVKSAFEYKQAIEFLYHHPEERKRLSRNAREYAMQIFGAEHAARKFNQIYTRLMQEPKQSRHWPMGESCKRAASSLCHNPPNSDESISQGAKRFVESIGSQSTYFSISLYSENISEVLAAEESISSSTELMKASGVRPYLNYFPSDGMLRLWMGLMHLESGEPEDALIQFIEATQNGCTHWRILWYIGKAALKGGNTDIAKQAVSKLLEVNPSFQPARDVLTSLIG